MAEKIIADIEKEHALKHVETVDKSGPMIENDVHIKKVDREGFLKAIEKGADLKHADTVDKSGPKVDASDPINLKKVDRNALLNEIKKQDQ